MDDEDLAEMRDAQKLVDTSEQMDLTGGTQAELHRRQGDEPKECVWRRHDSLETNLTPAAVTSPVLSSPHCYLLPATPSARRF